MGLSTSKKKYIDMHITERRSAGGHKRRRLSNCYCHRPTWEHQETGSGGPSDIRILTIYLPVLFFIFCIFVCIKKNNKMQFEAELVLNLFLFLGNFEARCSYKIVLIKKKCNMI